MRLVFEIIVYISILIWVLFSLVLYIYDNKRVIFNMRGNATNQTVNATINEFIGVIDAITNNKFNFSTNFYSVVTKFTDLIDGLDNGRKSFINLIQSLVTFIFTIFMFSFGKYYSIMKNSFNGKNFIIVLFFIIFSVILLYIDKSMFYLRIYMHNFNVPNFISFIIVLFMVILVISNLECCCLVKNEYNKRMKHNVINTNINNTIINDEEDTPTRGCC